MAHILKNKLIQGKKLLKLIKDNRIKLPNFKIKDKITNFIYRIKQRVKGKIELLHSRIKLIKESDLEKKYDRNPYEIIKDWFIDVIYYGVLLVITLTIINDYTWKEASVLVLQLGIARWLILDLIKSIRNKLR